MEKIKVYVPVEGVANYDAILAYVNENNTRLKVKEVELYCFTEDELEAFEEKIETQTMNVCGCYLGD